MWGLQNDGNDTDEYSTVCETVLFMLIGKKTLFVALKSITEEKKNKGSEIVFSMWSSKL